MIPWIGLPISYINIEVKHASVINKTVQMKTKKANKIEKAQEQQTDAMAIGCGAGKISEGFITTIHALLAEIMAQKNTHKLGDQMAITEQDEKKEGEVTTKNLDPNSQQKLQAVTQGKRGNITDIAFLAKAVKRPIVIYKDGKVFDMMGKSLPGKHITLAYCPEGLGHWAPVDKSVQVNISGQYNCLYDAVAAQLSPTERIVLRVQHGQDLRLHVVKKIKNNPTLSQKFLTQAAELSRLQPAAMLEGGRGFGVIRMARFNKITGKFEFQDGHAIQQISNEGGDKKDYFYVRDIDEKGQLIGDPALQVVSERAAGRIHVFGLIKDEKALASAFIAIDKSGKQLKGYFLQNAYKITPTGEYSLILSKTRVGAVENQLRYPNNYVFYNNKLGILDYQGFTIHNGNFPDNSQGCELPGMSIGIGRVGEVNDEKQPGMVQARVGYLRTFTSEPVRVGLELFVNDKHPIQTGIKQKGTKLEIKPQDLKDKPTFTLHIHHILL
jgi:hypothetical protein